MGGQNIYKDGITNWLIQASSGLFYSFINISMIYYGSGPIVVHLAEIIHSMSNNVLVSLKQSFKYYK